MDPLVRTLVKPAPAEGKGEPATFGLPTFRSEVSIESDHD